MIQKSSLREKPRAVSKALKADNRAAGEQHDSMRAAFALFRAPLYEGFKFVVGHHFRILCLDISERFPVLAISVGGVLVILWVAAVGVKRNRCTGISDDNHFEPA